MSKARIDAEGSVLTSLSSSAVLGEQIYGPYGNQRYTQGTVGTDKGYTGQFQDAVSGFDYYNARYYDPVMGQFLSADSVQGNAQGMDPYSYVNGNPETATDPTGHEAIKCDPGDGCSSGGGTFIQPTPTTCDTGFTLVGVSCQQNGPASNPCAAGPNSGNQCTYSSGPCKGLQFTPCQRGQQNQNNDKQNHKNHIDVAKLVIAGVTFFADLFSLIADAQKAAGIGKILEIIGDLISLIGDVLTFVSQVSQMLHWTGAQPFIDVLGSISNGLGAIYKGIRAALATPWGVLTAGALVVGFYAIRASLSGSPVGMGATILGLLYDHLSTTKDNAKKIGLQALGSGVQAYINAEQYQIDVLNSEDTSTYCHNNPASC